MPLFLKILITCLIVLGTNPHIQAQELPPPIEVEEDDNEDATDDVEQSKDIFEDDEEEAFEVDEDSGTHLLTFKFKSNVLFINQEGEENPTTDKEHYMEVDYTTEFAVPLNLVPGKFSKQVEAEFEVENSGSLASNEFFDCRLEIELKQLNVEIITKVKETKDGESGEITSRSLSLKIDFSEEETEEDWFSFCTETSGAKLNTKGDTEKYNWKILKATEPSLKSIQVEDFNPYDQTVIQLNSPSTIVNDLDLINDIILSGSGQITVESM